MKISKIIVPSNVYLVEIVSDKYLNDENKYEDALAILIKYCKNGIFDRNIVW